MTSPSYHRAAMLWTGGKDSCLAMHEAMQSGCDIQSLVTFVPPRPRFLAHPLEFIKKQSVAMGLSHHLVRVKEPFQRGYEDGMRHLKENMGIEVLVTGDIAEVGGQPNWIRERAKVVGMEIMTPLWKRKRLSLLRQLLTFGFKVVFSCVKKPWLTRDWIGREIDEKAILDLKRLHERNGMDPCGEEGEYHTLVRDGPFFKKSIRIISSHVRVLEQMWFLKIMKLGFVSK